MLEAPLAPLNSLRAFEATARHLNYHRAAEELHVSPAAVKQQVLKLEQYLGQALLVREGRNLALTAAGEAGLADLTAGFTSLRRASDKMQRPRGEQRLVISAERSFSAGWLVPRLSDFRRQYPDVQVLVDSTDRLVDLEAGEADIAIRYGIEQHQGLVAERLRNDRIYPVCSPMLAAQLAPNGRLEELTQMPMLHCELTGMAWAVHTNRVFHWPLWLEQVGAGHIEVSGGIYLSDYNQAVQSAIAGQGVLLGSEPVIAELLSGGLLVQPFKEVLVPPFGYDLVVSEKGLKRPQIRAFFNWLRERRD